MTALGGWLVSGKFDAHRHDAEANAVHHALRAVGRLLLAGSDAEVATARSRLRAELGANTGLAAAALPEFAALLDEPPEKELVPAGDSDATAHRLDQMGLDVLRAVASTTHPLVIVLDDLQWAAAVPVGFVDAVLNDESLRGVLLVGIYRGEEVDATHPLTAALARWRGLLPAPAVLTVDSLAPADLGDLLADMLRLPSGQVSDLAAAICERTGGNPYDTVEVVNELRREGALVVGSSGWTWDVDVIRRFVGQGDIIDLLAIRLGRLPDATRKLVEIVAYLGGDVPRDLLGTAAGLTRDEVDERLAPALENGLVLQDEGDAEAVRLRHDRVQQAAHSMRAPHRRASLHLSIARRLQASGLAPALAAGQFLAGAEAIRADQERRVVAELFVDAAKAVGVLNSSEAEHYLTAATGLLDAVGSSSDDPLVAEVQLQRHGVLYRLGRLGEADELYADLTARTKDPIALLELGCVQVDSLSIRGRPADAVALGLGLLRGVGVDVPEGDLTDSLRTWRDDLVRRGAAAPTEDFGAGVLDRRTLLAGRLITRLLPASFFLIRGCRRGWRWRTTSC